MSEQRISDAPGGFVAATIVAKKDGAGSLKSPRVFSAPKPTEPSTVPGAVVAATEQDEDVLAAVTLNSKAVSPGVPVLKRSGRLYARSSDLEAWRILVPHDARVLDQEGIRFVDLSDVPELVARFDPRRQQLDLTISVSRLRPVEIDYGRNRPAIAQAPSSPGAFLGYGLSAYRSGGSDTYSGLLGVGLFGPFGVLTSDLIATGGNSETPSVVRLDTTLRFDMPDRMQTIVAGDSLLSPLGPWGRAIRIGGIQFGTNFRTQPSFLTTPLQSISGTAAVPSVVDILVNGQPFGQRRVPAGNFTINDIPYVTGAGTVQAVVRDPLGREQVYAQSYYLSTRLLAKGLDEWGVEAGALRYNYGVRSADYQDLVGGGFWRRGFTDQLTGEVRTRVTREVQVVGGAIDTSLFEAVNATVSAAWSSADAGTGGVFGVGVQRAAPRGPSFSLQHYSADAAFREAGDPEDRLGFRSLFYGSAGLPLGRYGSVVAGYSRSTFWSDRPAYSLGTLSYYLTLPGNLFLSLSVSHGISGTTGTSAILNLMIPFGDRRTSAGFGLAFNSEADRAGQRTLQAQASLARNLPVGDGYGYRLAMRGTGDIRALGTVQNQFAQLQGEAGRSFGQDYGRVTLSGGGVWLNGHAELARDVSQSFALVDTSGVPGAPVYVNGNLYGRTQGDGMLVVPRLAAYSPNRISLRAKDFPLSYSLGETAKTITPYYRSGTVVQFEVAKLRQATARLIGSDGKPLRSGTPVRINRDGETFVGLDGEVFLRSLGASNELTATVGDAVCAFRFDFPEGTEDPIPDLGALACEK